MLEREPNMTSPDPVDTEKAEATWKLPEGRNVNEPIKSPDLERDGWTLESAVSRSEANPNTFVVPSQSERSSIKVGPGVKLVFWIQGRKQFPICERMWVVVEEVIANGEYVGRLESKPATKANLIPGQRLIFGPDHVAEIVDGPTGYEERARSPD